MNGRGAQRGRVPSPPPPCLATMLRAMGRSDVKRVLTGEGHCGDSESGPGPLGLQPRAPPVPPQPPPRSPASLSCHLSGLWASEPVRTGLGYGKALSSLLFWAPQNSLRPETPAGVGAGVRDSRNQTQSHVPTRSLVPGVRVELTWAHSFLLKRSTHASPAPGAALGTGGTFSK